MRKDQFLPSEKQVFANYGGKSPGQAGPGTMCTTAITHHVRERKEPNTEVTEKRENKSVQSKPFLREFIKLGGERHSREFFLVPQMLKARAGDGACNFSAACGYFKWGVKRRDGIHKQT